MSSAIYDRFPFPSKIITEKVESLLPIARKDLRQGVVRITSSYKALAYRQKNIQELEFAGGPRLHLRGSILLSLSSEYPKNERSLGQLIVGLSVLI